jgi:hypothetical protein
MRLKDGTEPGAGVRGAHVVTVGEGGNAKLRSARLITIGLDGHDGLVNGMTVTAVRSGIIPTSAGGNGVTEYASGDAGPYPNEDTVLTLATGPGIRRMIQLEGQEGNEKPQYGILQKFGARTILPEFAVIGLHAGGAGDVITVARDETDASDVIAKLEKDGQQVATAYRSNPEVVTIADDSISTYLLPRSDGFIHITSPGSTTRWARFGFRAVSGAEVVFDTASGASVDISTGALTGTTGADGKVTISINAQTMVIENRVGATVQFNWSVL